MLDPHLVGHWDSGPEIPLADFLAQRRALAHIVARAALRVIDAIDQNPPAS